MTCSLNARLMTVLSVALTFVAIDGFAAPKRGGSKGQSISKSTGSWGSTMRAASGNRMQSKLRTSQSSNSIRQGNATQVLSRTNNSTQIKPNFGRNQIKPNFGSNKRKPNLSGNNLKPDFGNRQFKPTKQDFMRNAPKTQLQDRAGRITNLNKAIDKTFDKTFNRSTLSGKGRAPLKLNDLSIREKLNKPFIPLGNYQGGNLNNVLKHKKIICTTPGYQKCLKYAHGCNWFHRSRCGWWGHLATTWYHHHHGRYCPDYYWDHCYRYRCVYIACPATAQYDASYWFFGCDVVMVPGVGYGVTAVTPDSPAALAGIKQGDMITQVGGQTPEDDSLLATAVQQSNGQLNMAVLRDGNEQPEAMQVALRRIQKSSL